MKAEKAEKISGYILLAIGLIFIILPAMLALVMFLAGWQVPQLVPTQSGETDSFVRAVATFSNVCLIAFIFVVLIWTGSILSSRGVTLIKNVKLKLVRKSLREAAEVAERLENEEA
jgi:hypothetical protein